MSQMPHMFEALLFDKDGTLVEFAATWHPVIGLLVPWLSAETGAASEDVASIIGFDTSQNCLASDSPVLTETTAELAARLATTCGRGDGAPEFAVDLDRFMQAHVAETLTPVEGAADVLRTLGGSGIHMGIVTNDAEGSARMQIGLLGWTELFDVVLGYNSGFGGKPGPGIVHAAIEALGADRQHTALVGDTATDVEAAHAAGIAAILIGDAATARPDVTLASLRDLPAILGA